MENNRPKIFTRRAIYFATMFGGPFAAGFLISKNFKTFGKEDAARKSIFIGIQSTILLLVVDILIYKNNNIDESTKRTLQSLSYFTSLMIISLILEIFQGKKINKFIRTNGQKATFWQTAKYALYGFIFMLSLSMFYMTTSTKTKVADLEKYQISELHTIYHNSSMPIEDLIKVEGAIKSLKNYFPVDKKIAIIFLNEKNNYTIKVYLPKNYWEDKQMIQKNESLIDYIKSSGVSKDITLVLIDNKTLEEKEMKLP